MNSFGRVFRISIFGESHGCSLGILIDGCPPGLPLVEEDFCVDLERRQAVGALGVTKRREHDKVQIRSGLFKGLTTGAPLMLAFENQDVDSSFYETTKHTPRPGHADFVAYKKYRGFNDYRGGGHFSGRLTAGVVAAGVVAKKLIAPIEVSANLEQVRGSKDIDAEIQAAESECDSVGGIVRCVASSLPIGLGEPFFDSLESLISHGVFSIPAVKGIEFGMGFDVSKLRGSEVNDEIVSVSGETRTNHAGGINGGISNGNDLEFRVAIKPTSSIGVKQETINLESGTSQNIEVKGRHDVCVARRVPVVVEAMTAVVLADLLSLQRINIPIQGDQ